MNLNKKKELLKRKIKRQKNKTLIKESKLKGKIATKKELLSLEKELQAAKQLDIPEKDMKLLEAVNKDEEKSFKSQLKKVLAKIFKWLGEAFHAWVERERKAKEAQRKLMEKKE